MDEISLGCRKQTIILITRSVFAFLSIVVSVPLLALELEHLWTIEAQFEMPESAVIDTKREMIYLSNVNTYALDGNGFISRISMDGNKLDKQWITGINSPTGIAIHGDLLYFADVDALVIVDLRVAEIIARIEAPDDQPALNDVAISDNGEVFVSGSRSRTIYQLNDGKLKVWLKNKRLFEHANGLLTVDENLVHGGLLWTTFDIATKTTQEQALSPDDNLRDFDGIATDGMGGFVVTLIDDPRVWHIRADGSNVHLSKEPLNGIDLDIRSGYLALPRVGGSLSLYRLLPEPLKDRMSE